MWVVASLVISTLTLINTAIIREHIVYSLLCRTLI